MPDDMTMNPTPPPQYPLSLQGVGGGQGCTGLCFREKVWTSDNGRHEVGVNGECCQRLGGPYGISQPQWNLETSFLPTDYQTSKF